MRLSPSAVAHMYVYLDPLRKRSIELLESFCSADKPPGMISTCSYCRKAKDERGQWIYLDQFLSHRTNLNFSHGICDGCMEEHFPEVVEAWNAGLHTSEHFSESIKSMQPGHAN